MNKRILIIFGFFSICMGSLAQISNNKTLFVIDSIPLLVDPEEWNQILQEDIADYTLITQKDSLKLLGWEQVDGITYVFTKAYHSRPDSIKKIPSLKQMIIKDGNWYLHDTLYTGKYLDYYNNGRIQNEGTILNGKTNGELTVYYPSGIKKSITNFKDGIRHGLWKEYYQNGALMRTDEFVNGKATRIGKLYFINGQIKQELKLKNETSYDTSVVYYSTGKIEKIKMTKTPEFHPDKKEADMNYYTTMFYQYLQTGDIRAANKSFYQIWIIDSTSTDTYFKQGLLLANEFRFDRAIVQFDKALAIEPLMREALQQRALTRIKRYKFSIDKVSFKNRKDVLLTLEDFMLMPEEEQIKACHDVLLADDINPGVNYNNKTLPAAILNYCREKSSH
ncbi:MAG: toxin-antitoxin system YwqK family antitoxin [Ginsengibacter sp.]